MSKILPGVEIVGQINKQIHLAQQDRKTPEGIYLTPDDLEAVKTALALMGTFHDPASMGETTLFGVKIYGPGEIAGLLPTKTTVFARGEAFEEKRAYEIELPATAEYKLEPV